MTTKGKNKIETKEVKCECSSYDCKEKILLTPEEYEKYRNQDWFVISDQCKHGAEPSDQFMEEKDGYKLYKMLFPF